MYLMGKMRHNIVPRKNGLSKTKSFFLVSQPGEIASLMQRMIEGVAAEQYPPSPSNRC